MKKTNIILLFLMAMMALTTCHKDEDVGTKVPVVSDYEMTVNATEACISWKVDYVGKYSTGLVVSRHENMTDARQVDAEKEDGKYVAVVDGLTPLTQYYYRVVVWNRYASYTQELKDFRTEGKPSYQIKASCLPAEGGRVTGAGQYEEGKRCPLHAICNDGYEFVKWTENGTTVSTDETYTFDVTKSRTLVANFALQRFTVALSADPSGGGFVSGGGEYAYGQSCTVSATANNGYTFSKWTENDTQVSTDANYTFTISGDRTLVAHFTELPPDEYNINVSAHPLNGGTVSGGGTYQEGQYCTVTATANEGYTFTNWTENGNVVSSNASYTFTVNSNRTLVANFTAKDYTIGVSANPASGGSVTGGGNYHYGSQCTVSAIANEGYTFTKWTKDGNLVSNQANYTFVVTDSRDLVAVFTQQSYTISVSANPSAGGTVTDGGGNYHYGDECTVNATANSGYTFTNWTENGNEVSTNPNYTFTVTSNRTLVAHFAVQTPNTYNINVSSNPSAGGTVSGGGTYQQGQNCTVHATANSGYTFTNWTENGSEVSTNSNYTFTVTSNRVLVAHFNVQPQAPIGAINGLYTINNNGDQVYFSQGNLQYQPSTSTWRFATNQYDCIGSDNSNISSSYSGWLDLFGWGTSGWNCSNTYYRPWDSSISCAECYGPPGDYNLTGSYTNSDWGRYNAISNGGNTSNTWRTLTHEEWVYVFNTRSTTSGIRYAMAQVNNVNGVILLPDNWSSSYYTLYSTNQTGASFSSNVISSSTWTNSLQSHGAIFLPAAGYRNGTTVQYGGSSGRYWSVSSSSLEIWGNGAKSVQFNGNSLNPGLPIYRYFGLSIRLVCPAQ